MNIDRLMKKIKSKLRVFLWFSYLVEAMYALSSSVLIAKALSGMISAIIYRESQEEVIQKLAFLVCVSLGIIFLLFLNKINGFLRTKKTAYEIEDEVYDYFFKIKYYNNIKKDEMQAYITKSLIEYNSLYFSTISETIRVSVTIVVSVIYSMIITPYSSIVVAFIAGLLFIILKGKLDKVPEIRKGITKHNNDLYRNLWEGIENLEIERFLNPDAVFEGYSKNTKMLVGKRIEYNKIVVRADFLSQFGNILSVILIVIIGLITCGFNADSIGKILPLVIIIPNISAGIFAVPALMTNKRNMKGIRNYLNSYFVFECSDNLEADKIEELQVGLLKVKNIIFSYNGIKNILDGVSLEFERGKITTIIGENGCGKSTLLKLCALLIPMKEGQLCICNRRGEDLLIDAGNSYSETDRKKYWYQVYYMDPVPKIIPASLEKNIILNDLYDEDRFKAALKKAGLENFRDRDFIDAHNISSGEAQKIAFARIFYHKYNVIFLDESTSHMDPQTEEKIMREFQKSVREEEIIAVAVSHKNSFNIYSDVIFRMEQGKFVLSQNLQASAVPEIQSGMEVKDETDSRQN